MEDSPHCKSKKKIASNRMSSSLLLPNAYLGVTQPAYVKYNEGGGGGGYTAGSNISIQNSQISVVSNPTFSNINVTTINNSAYPPAGGGGVSAFTVNLGGNFVAGTGIAPKGESTPFTVQFPVVAGHTYTITTGLVVEQTNFNQCKLQFTIPSLFTTCGMGAIEAGGGQAYTTSFRAFNNASDASIQIVNYDANNDATIFLTNNPNDYRIVVLDCGAI